VNCPNCGDEYLLYYGQIMSREEAENWLLENLIRTHPSHKGWLVHDEDTPVSDAEHRQRVEYEISKLQRLVDIESAAALETSGDERAHLIGSYTKKQGMIRELQEEL
jgi:hypothetical protein